MEVTQEVHYFLHGTWNTFSPEFLMLVPRVRLTYEKTDIILLHLLQANLQEHLNGSDVTEGNILHLSMVGLLDQLTQETATPLMNLKRNKSFCDGTVHKTSSILFKFQHQGNTQFKNTTNEG